MFCTSRPAGPVIGVKVPGRGERGEVRGGAAEGTSPFSPLPKTSARSVGITGSSASRPLSKSCRQSSETEAGSRRYCSYITCTKARSEEHTSELQSLAYLVCRLLLEKKKKKPTKTYAVSAVR